MSVLCSIVGASFVTAVAQILRSKKSIAAISVEVDTAHSQFGGASMAIGSGYLRIADHSSFSFGTGDFTIEFWFRPIVLDGIDIIWDQRPNGSQGIQPTIYTTNSQLFYYTAAGNRITCGNLTTNTWQHIALSRSGTSTRMFINGTQTGSTYTDTNNYVSSSQGVWIGADQYFGGNNSVGNIDEIRISNSARYNANFTPSTTPFVNDANTLLLIHANGTDASTFFEDDNGIRAQKGITAFGNAQVDTAQSYFGGASALFDGSGDYLLVNDNFSFGTDNYTIECWYRPITITNARHIFEGRRSSANQVAPVIFHNGGTLTYNLGVNTLITSSGSTIVANTWHHIAVSRSGTSTRMFVNGTQVGSTATDSTNYPTFQPVLGAYFPSDFGPAAFVNGHMDEIRVSNSARYTANFTPSTTPFVNDANTLLLIHADGTDASTVFRDDNGSGRTQKGVQAIGNAQIDTAQSKFGGSSALFDGSGDWLRVASHPDFAYGTGDWTIEWWQYITSISAGDTLLDQRSAEPTAAPTVYYRDGTNITFYANGADRIIGGAITTNSWQHIALCKSAGSTRLFINGTQSGSTFTDTITYVQGGDLVFNGRFALDFAAAGHFDEVRISNTARYTANFTAPTAPFQNDANTLLLLHMDGTDGSTVFFDDNGRTPTP